MPVYAYKINWRNTLALMCGKRICIGLPEVGKTVLPGIRQNSSRFVVWKLLHLKPEKNKKRMKTISLRFAWEKKVPIRVSGEWIAKNVKLGKTLRDIFTLYEWRPFKYSNDMHESMVTLLTPIWIEEAILIVFLWYISIVCSNWIDRILSIKFYVSKLIHFFSIKTEWTYQSVW